MTLSHACVILSSVAFISTFIHSLECKWRPNHIIAVVVFVSDWDSLTRGDRPLQDSELDKIQAVYFTLVSCLQLDDELVSLLYQKNCITKMQKEFVSQSSCTSTERTKRLLEIIQRGSFANYCAFLDCLHQIGQIHVAEVLQPGGAYYHPLCVTEWFWYEPMAQQNSEGFQSHRQSVDQAVPPPGSLNLIEFL